jgi:hypothetical protein
MEEFEKMAGELAESEAEGEVQDANMHSSEEPAADQPASEEAAAPAEAESSVEAGAEEQELTPSGGAGEPTPVAES